ncbi:hypothetical protein ACXYTJ_02175 [Gilvimarinus sp. F26214L]|uniref:hypothetical protein n=1 Tax=Gilvimarinus sp. DZF01 TaxID=3461371 RepID=UPI0040455DBB
MEGTRFALRLNNRIQRLGTGQITAEQYRAETKAEGYGAIAGIMMMSPIDEGGLVGLALGKGAGHRLRAGKGAEGVVELTAQQQKAIRSLEKQIAKHEKKLKDFKDNPTVRPGRENQPKDAILKQQRRRVEHLETEITTFRDNIDKIRRGEIDS